MASRGISSAMIAFRLFFAVCVGAIFGMLGGLLGVALFRRKDLPPGTTEVLPPA
jgi:NhaP-type Na+/H+ and K+/H+ antiporter